jgi:hypothetical protein
MPPQSHRSSATVLFLERTPALQERIQRSLQEVMNPTTLWEEQLRLLQQKTKPTVRKSRGPALPRRAAEERIIFRALSSDPLFGKRTRVNDYCCGLAACGSSSALLTHWQ